MKLLSEFPDGKCLFCGNDAKENFYSGSCETYLWCDCKKREEYYEKRKELKKLEKPAKDRYKKIKLEEEKRHLEDEMKIINGRLKELV